MPHMLGPYPYEDLAPSPRALVVTFVGEKARDNLVNILDCFGLQDFSFMLFVYDHMRWISHLPWVNHPDVTILYKPGQMKWWYVKHWLPPHALSNFDYVIIIDEDCDVVDFQPLLYMKLLREYKVKHCVLLSVMKGWCYFKEFD